MPKPLLLWPRAEAVRAPKMPAARGEGRGSEKPDAQRGSLSGSGPSLVAQVGKSPSARQELKVRLPGGKDCLEKEMATHSGILAWRIPRTEKPGGLQSIGSQTVGRD